MGYVKEGDPFPVCTCKTCEAGHLTAGHCVDIDGDYWHDCKATLTARAPGRS